MEIDYYAQYFAFEHDDWWFVARRQILFELLTERIGPDRQGLRILDVGCGTGINLGHLEQFGTVYGLDSEATALSFCRMRKKKDLVNARTERLPFEDGTFDLVTALDVLEHLEEDRQAAGEFARVLKPGGLLLATVPAFQGLWSDHDIINHHRRRYRKGELVGLLGGSFEVEKVSYYNTFLLPLAVFIRTLKRFAIGLRKNPYREIKAENTYLPRTINTAFRKVFAAERFWLKKRDFPVGLSILAVGKKKAE